MVKLRNRSSIWPLLAGAILLGGCGIYFCANNPDAHAQQDGNPLIALQRQIDQLHSDQNDRDALLQELALRVWLLEEFAFGGGGDGGGGAGGGGGDGGGDLDTDGDGFTPNAGDFDDGDPTSYPGAPEIPDDFRDNDGDGTIDEVD